MDLPAELPTDIATLQALLRASEARVAERDAIIERKEDRIVRLEKLVADFKRALFGATSAKADPDQYQLALEDIETAIVAVHAEDEAVDPPASKPKTRNANRGALPKHLPRIEEVIEPQSRICNCGCERHVIGDDVSERLDIIPAQFRVIVTRRPKYACRSCEGGILEAPAKPHLIEGGMPTEATVASIIVAKFADHLPLYRQAQIYARQGVDLDRSTLAAWVGQAAYELTPVYDALLANLKQSTKLFMDETTAPVLDPGRGKVKKGYFWALARDDCPWGGDDPPGVAFTYAPGRSGKHAVDILQGFDGILQVDGYTGYNRVTDPKANADIKLAYCWAHARRKLFELTRNSTATIAKEMGWLPSSPKRHRDVPRLWCLRPRKKEDGDMKDTMIGIDLAKNAFQVHGASMAGHVKFRKKLSRGQFFRFISEQPPALVVMEACGSAHYWARELVKAGHEVKLIAPQYVRPFVKRQKNDAADAEAIVIAARQPEMRFVEPKTSEQQARAVLFRARERIVHQRTELVNALRSTLYEYGQVVPLGISRIKQIEAIIESEEVDFPELVREECRDLLAQIGEKTARIEEKTKRLAELSQHSDTARRLQTMPGVGPMTALAVEAFAPAMKNFRCGRDFAAWLGLVPRQFSSGGRERLGRVSKAGQADIRRLLIIGAMACVNWASRKPPKQGSWLARMLSRKPRMLVAIALANKMARKIWAMLTKNEDYRDPALAAVV